MVVAAFNQEKALVGAFSVITNLRMELFEALLSTHVMLTQDRAAGGGGEDGLHSLHREGAGGGRPEDQQRHPVQAAAPLQQR